MRNFLLFSFFPVIALSTRSFSCQPESVVKEVKPAIDSFSEEALIYIQLYSFRGNSPTCWLNYKHGKADTLYLSTSTKIQGKKDSVSYFKQVIDPAGCDSIYHLAQKALGNFKFPDEKSFVKDGLNVQLFIRQNSATYLTSWEGLTHVNDLPQETRKLIDFINRKLPAEHRIN